jgi:hypothetical protein
LIGLDNVTSVGNTINIDDNDALTSLTGLQGLSSIGRNLMITMNNELPNFLGLENLTILEADLIIKYNSGLTSLSGIENIDAESMGGLAIHNNQLLSECEILSVCDYLNHSIETAEISGNAEGCNTPEQVLDSCEANAGNIDWQYLKEYLNLYPNPANQVLNISAEGVAIYEVVIYTLTGQKVSAIRPKSETIDISTLQTGMYIVEVMVEGTKIRQKLLVQ